MKRVLTVIAHGSGGQDEIRARRLTSLLDADVAFYGVNRSVSHPAAMRELWRRITAERFDLIYLEGTGIAAGLTMIRAARFLSQPFIVSSGDPIGGFFSVTKGPAAGAVFGAYERALYRSCAGFVGWTPYLTGAAIHMGAPRAVTVEGAADLSVFTPCARAARNSIKEEFGLDPSHLVCGVVGSLNWTARQSYAYGLELVEILKRTRRTDLSVLIVGDGNGRTRLESLVPEPLRERIVFTGRLPEQKVAAALNAMDIGFITQTLDQLGNFRLTTKLPEYLASGLPIAMSPIPGFYDYIGSAGWPLPVGHPAHPDFHERCAVWLDSVCWDEVREKARQARPIAETRFDYVQLSKRFCRFASEVMQLND